MAPIEELSWREIVELGAVMASNDPGLAQVPLAEDPADERTQDHKPSTGDFKGEGASLTPPTSDEEPIAPDQFDATYETSKWEIWAYYSYYIGNNGLTLFNFAPTAFQNLLSQAADNSGVIHFAGADRTINSVVLLCNGISFAIQIFVFLVIGSLSKASFT